MEIVPPHVDTIPVRCCPKKAPYPTCGKLAPRKDVHPEWSAPSPPKKVVFLELTSGESRARCGCCTTFRTTPSESSLGLSDNKVREAVLDRILDDGMSVDQVVDSMSRDFLLDLSLGFDTLSTFNLLFLEQTLSESTADTVGQKSADGTRQHSGGCPHPGWCRPIRDGDRSVRRLVPRGGVIVRSHQTEELPALSPDPIDFNVLPAPAVRREPEDPIQDSEVGQDVFNR